MKLIPNRNQFGFSRALFERNVFVRKRYSKYALSLYYNALLRMLYSAQCSIKSYMSLCSTE